jgi:hypothetical protein
MPGEELFIEEFPLSGDATHIALLSLHVWLIRNTVSPRLAYMGLHGTALGDGRSKGPNAGTGMSLSSTILT